jgi:hypothetical protein
MLKVKSFLIRTFKKSVGIIPRLIQYSLNKNESTVISLIMEKSIERSAIYAMENFSSAIIFNSREEIYKYCLTKHSKSENVKKLILEFGVCNGESINYFAKLDKESVIYGFDSFEGLQENWYAGTALKNSMSTEGKLPKVKNNVTLIKGWYEDSLPGFITQLGNKKIDVLHLDSDTYTPTAFVLNSLVNNLRPGSIVIFDEFFGYPNWENFEFKAWNEFNGVYKMNTKCIAFSKNQVAFEWL